jgi:hypothetical protein
MRWKKWKFAQNGVNREQKMRVGMQEGEIAMNKGKEQSGHQRSSAFKFAEGPFHMLSSNNVMIEPKTDIRGRERFSFIKMGRIDNFHPISHAFIIIVSRRSAKFTKG